MKLLTKEIEAGIPKLYSQDGVDDPVLVAKFFDPMSDWTWYVIDGSREGDDFIFFGLVRGFETELGNFSLNELESIGKTRVLGIERDTIWRPRKLSEVRGILEAGGHQ